MISGIHLATALSVMLHMEQEGDGMKRVSEVEMLLRKWADVLDIPSGDFVNRDLISAADRLSEQQQVIDELFAVLTYVRNRIEKSEEWWMDCPDKGGFDTDIIDLSLSRAKGHTKGDE